MSSTRIQFLESAPAIIEASSEAIATINGSGAIQSSNHRFTILLGLDEQSCQGHNIGAIFPDLDLLAMDRSSHLIFEPMRMVRPDGKENWVLLKIIRVGSGQDSYFTLLIQDPEVMRRIIDRLDYVENYDPVTGLLNRHKGLLEFEQVQASNLTGGCLLIRFGLSLTDGQHDALLVRSAKQLLNIVADFGQQQIGCRYSASEIFLVYCDEATPQTHWPDLRARLLERLEIPADAYRAAFQDWSGTRQEPNGLIEALRLRLAPLLDDPSVTGSTDQTLSTQPPADYLARLQQAISDTELRFFIQPQVNTESRTIQSGELLVRWIAPNGAITPPAHFIAHLEEGALAQQFMVWAVRETARLCRQIEQQTGQWLCLSVNISPSQIIDPSLVNLLAQACAMHQVPPESIEIEITERILATDTQQVLDVLKTLKRKGFKIAIDDFGTGYSSLAYLRQFPLDRLKIDRVFVINVTEHEEDRLISSSIASLAHVLGLEVVVEGIEHPAQALFFQQIGCEFFQGYLTGKPMVPEEFVQYVQDQARTNPLAFLGAPEALQIEQSTRPIAWKKSFSTDVVSVDKEHRDLVDALNLFTERYQSDPAGFDYLAAMDQIGAEAIKHFDHEEAVMRNIGYPRYEAHKEKHKSLIADFCKRRTELEQQPETLQIDELIRYLKYWLLRHLVSEDTQLHRHINRSSSDSPARPEARR